MWLLKKGPDMAENKKLKLDLMLLGNKLVTENGYAPGEHGIGSYFMGVLNKFVRALNSDSTAREALVELGYEWPVVESELGYGEIVVEEEK